MRKELILACLNDEILIVIDFLKFPPSILASFQFNTNKIIDFAYHDEHKFLVSSDEARGLSLRQLSDDNIYFKVIDYQVRNIVFINDSKFAVSSTTNNDILLFNIQRQMRTMLFYCNHQPKTTLPFNWIDCYHNPMAYPPVYFQSMMSLYQPHRISS